MTSGTATSLSRSEVRSLGVERLDESFLRYAREVLARRQVGRFYDANGTHQDGYTAALESAFETWTGVPHAVATASGTQALVIALAALGVAGGDVLLPEYAATQCALAVIMAGARPVLCQPRDDLSMDWNHAAELVSSATKAILVVHMRGVPSDVESLRGVSRGLPIIEDCSQFDALAFEGAPQSPASDVAVFSFQARKILTAGEGGMLTCRDEALYRAFVQACDSVWFMRPQYAEWAAPDRFIGGARMNEITAAMLMSQMAGILPYTEQLRDGRRGLEERLPHGAIRTRSIDWADVGGTLVMRCDPAEGKRLSSALSAAGIRCFPESAGHTDPHTCVGWPKYVRDCVKMADTSVGGLLAGSLLVQVDPEWRSERFDSVAAALAEAAELA